MPTSTDLLLCSGAPLDPADDKNLGQIVRSWKGKKIVAGGTTAKIIARELNRTITVVPNARGVTLPPTSKIAGINIVCEGVITLGCVRSMLENMASGDDHQLFIGLESSVDARIVHELLAHRHIRIIVGTRLNIAHFDPSLPINLERRVDILDRIAKILINDFRKSVDIEYM